MSGPDGAHSGAGQRIDAKRCINSMYECKGWGLTSLTLPRANTMAMDI